MKQALRWKHLILPLVFALAAGAQNPGDPIPGIGGAGSTAINFFALLQEAGVTIETPARITATDVLVVDTPDTGLEEFSGRTGILILSLQTGDWRNAQAALVALDLEQNRLVTAFGDNGVAPVVFNEGANFVEDLFVQPDGKIVAGGYVSSATETQIAVARFLANGHPDPSFGVGGYAVYSVFEDDDPEGALHSVVNKGAPVYSTFGGHHAEASQYSVCNKVTPIYDDFGRILEYIASGQISGEPPAGRALVFLDASGNFIRRSVLDLTGENPVTIPTKNGAIVQEPWGDYTGVAQMAGGFMGLSSSHEGSTLERFSYSLDNSAIAIMNRQPFNPDPENFPDNLVYVQGMAFDRVALLLWTTGFFMPDWQNPEYDTEVPYIARTEVGPCGADIGRRLLNFPTPVSGHQNLMFSDVIHAPMAMAPMNKHGVLDKAWQRPPTAEDHPSPRTSGGGEERFYVIGGGDRAEEDDHDVLIMRYLPDGSVDEEFGEGGLAVLDFGPNEWWVASAFTSARDLLVCVSTGDSTYLTVLRGSTATYAVTGTIRDGAGNPLDNVNVSFSDGTSVLTGVDGTYLKIVRHGDGLTVIPTKDGYTFDPVSIELADITSDIPDQDFEGAGDTGVGASGILAGEFTLHPVYPNPFNAGATVSFHVPRQEKVRLSVIDIKGREVETLLSGPAAAGEHRLVWDGSGLASGTYFIRLETPSLVRTQKAVLLQ